MNKAGTILAIPNTRKMLFFTSKSLRPKRQTLKRRKVRRWKNDIHLLSSKLPRAVACLLVENSTSIRPYFICASWEDHLEGRASNKHMIATAHYFL